MPVGMRILENLATPHQAEKKHTERRKERTTMVSMAVSSKFSKTYGRRSLLRQLLLVLESSAIQTIYPKRCWDCTFMHQVRNARQ